MTQSNYRVVVVDDNRDAAAMLGKLLSLKGFDTTVVTDSTAALAHILEVRPDFILLDLAMPRLPGHELAKLIRQQPTISNVPLICVSGFGDKVHAALALEAGFDHFLTKPVSLNDFQQIVDAETAKRSS